MPRMALTICCVTRRASLAGSLPRETVAKVLALPCSQAPGNATHWTGRFVAKAVGVSLRGRPAHLGSPRLQPHRLRTFKMSRDPTFAEKSQIHALDRTQPGLPLKPGKCATLTHDYKRNGTTTPVRHAQCSGRHRRRLLIRHHPKTPSADTSSTTIVKPGHSCGPNGRTDPLRAPSE
jgi:hypothetical protein